MTLSAGMFVYTLFILVTSRSRKIVKWVCATYGCQNIYYIFINFVKLSNFIEAYFIFVIIYYFNNDFCKN